MNRGQNDPDFRNISYIPPACSKCFSAFNLLLACSRLSDSGEDAKKKGTRKVGGAEIFVLALIQGTRLSRSLEQANLLWVSLTIWF